MWDLSCPDWEDRIRQGRSLIPALPLIESEAAMGVAFYDEMRLSDVPGMPRLKDASGQWFRDIARVAFGSWDPLARVRHVRDIFALAQKGSSKTSYGAALSLSIMLMNQRPNAEALFIGPTQAISDRAYGHAVGMIEASEDLKRRFRPRDHIKTIVDLVNGSELAVRTFDLRILTGAALIFALLDELHLLGRNASTTKVLHQIRGGLDKTEEGLLLITTTQSDDVPAGAFKDELIQARKIRDGAYRGKVIRPMLPVLYEFPHEIATDPAKWQDPANWPMVMPNLGRSVHLATLVPNWESERQKGDHSIRTWASQHLNIEMGVGMKTEGWPGAEFWAGSEDATLTLDSLIERCEVIVVGIDGGGLDDLFGLAALGRERTTKRWLAWTHAWCHRGVLQRRQTIAAQLQDFEGAGELTIVDDKLEDLAAIVEIIVRINDAGLLACVALDVEGPYGELVDDLDEAGITEAGEQVVGITQGYKLMGAIKASERKLANGSFVHAPSGLMAWCVGNVKIEATATAIRATKQNAGDAKIDPWCALMDAATVMVRNPEARGRSVYEQLGALEAQQSAERAQAGGDQAAIDYAALQDVRHPQFAEMKRRFEARQARLDVIEEVW